MKKILVLTLVSFLIMGFASSVMAENSSLEIIGDGQNATTFSTERNAGDYVESLIALTEADSAGDIIYPDDNEFRYLFVPLKKGGDIIAYGTWVNTVVYQHPEDIIVAVKPDGSILKWQPLDSNDHHPEMKDEEYLSRFYGMTLDTPFNPETDVISGSTISTNNFFFEMRNVLLVYNKYIAAE